MSAWIKDNPGRALAYLVILLLLVVWPVVGILFGLGRDPHSDIPSTVCTRTLC